MLPPAAQLPLLLPWQPSAASTQRSSSARPPRGIPVFTNSANMSLGCLQHTPWHHTMSSRSAQQASILHASQAWLGLHAGASRGTCAHMSSRQVCTLQASPGGILILCAHELQAVHAAGGRDVDAVQRAGREHHSSPGPTGKRRRRRMPPPRLQKIKTPRLKRGSSCTCRQWRGVLACALKECQLLCWALTLPWQFTQEAKGHGDEDAGRDYCLPG